MRYLKGILEVIPIVSSGLHDLKLTPLTEYAQYHRIISMSNIIISHLCSDPTKFHKCYKFFH